MLLKSWERHLKATNRAPNTILKYTQIGRQYEDWLGVLPLATVGKRDLESYIAHVLDTRKASTAATHYQALRQLYKWLEEEGELTGSTGATPFLKMKPPLVPEQLTPVLSKAQICSLLQGANTRNVAIIRTLLDTGIRVGELIALTTQDVDLGLDTLTVFGKGRRVRVVPFGDKTATALERWLRVRVTTGNALWIGKKGPLTCSGVRLMLRRKGTHPHALRHTAVHNWLAAGMAETSVMRLAGWRSRSMLLHYAASTGQERAIEAHKRLALGNNW